MSVYRRCLSLALILTLTVPVFGQEDTSERTRAVSDTLAAALADTMPKFNPPPEQEEEEEDFFPEPKNGIVRLPTVVVEGERPPIFTEREINTDAGLEQIAVQRYFDGAAQALNAVHIPILGKSNEALAMEMWAEDERLRHMADFNERAEMESALGEEEEAAETRRLIREATARDAGLPPAALHRETKGN
jgi:hypothetical protein